MSESEATEPETAVETDGAEDAAKAERKRARHRKKLLFERIRKQMEFYFSDANLTKDRFLGSLTRSEPAVPLDVFLKFNKIRSLTQDVRDIAKALVGSSLLECTDDNTKVRRVTQLEEYDAESRTVYVESVPGTAGRDWLEGVFGQYGPVAYISLPKFKNSQRIKGFAFIEYIKPEDAQKCIAAFAKMGCKLPTCMAPEQLTTIKTFSVDEPEKPADESSADESKMDSSKEDRKRPADRRKSDEAPPKKKQKKKNRKKKEKANGDGGSNNTTLDAEVSVQNLEASREDIKPSDVEIKDKDGDTGVSSQGDSTETKTETAKKRCRKRTAKERNKAKNKLGKSGLPSGAVLGLQVLSKLEWRVLRNKYLNLQRKQMKELKNSLRMQGAYQAPTNTDATRTRERDAEKKAVEFAASASRLHKVEGVFVKVELPEPCLDVRLTKRQVRTNIHVQHVDVKEGQREMIVRFDTPDSAQQYCTSGIYSCARVLVGAESEAEWSRVSEARGEGAGARRARGRTRLLERAAAVNQTSPALVTSGYEPSTTHIRFDD